MQSKNYIKSLIEAGIEEPEARKELSILEKEVKDPSKIEKVLNERIKTRKPLQYILGKSYFMDFEVEVNENVLIPRPETELLVEETVRRGLPTSPTILDIGTGSGIIPIALAKKLPGCKIIALDINKEIIELASRNAIKNSVDKQISFKICDVFSKCFEGLINANKFDLIISNPPYVKDENLKTLSPEVQHEPKEALVGSKENKSGLIYYERILEVVIAKCHSRLDRESRNKPQVLDSHFRGNDKLLLAFEIDPSLVNDLKSLMDKYKIEKYEFVKDYSKLDRFLFIFL